MVTNLGLRVGDVKALKLSELNWSTKTITIIQEKTKRETTYPILHDVGWALTDYLKNARPVCITPHVFIRMVPPYEAFGGHPLAPYEVS